MNYVVLPADLQGYYNIRKKWRMILFWIVMGLFASWTYIVSWNTEAFSKIQKTNQSKSASFTRVKHFGTKMKKFDDTVEIPYLEAAISYAGLRKPEPIKNIVFHKTHKCSSTTIQNILFRYAMNNELLVVLPKIGYSFSKFKYNTIQNTEWYQAGIQPHIFCLHNIWDGSEVAKLYKNKRPYYFSILRDPLSVLISSWDYYGFDNMLGMDLEGFAYFVAKSNGMYVLPNHIVLEILSDIINFGDCRWN